MPYRWAKPVHKAAAAAASVPLLSDTHPVTVGVRQRSGLQGH